MRSLVSTLLGYVLALMLMGTSPIGTGQGVHQNQLLDALVPHVHFIGGQQGNSGATASDPTLYRSGPALGSAAGATAAASGLALTAPLPSNVVSFSHPTDRWQFPANNEVRPRGRTEAPPDPPPTLWA